MVITLLLLSLNNCIGFQGQSLAVIPSKKLVIVRFALDEVDRLQGSWLAPLITNTTTLLKI